MGIFGELYNLLENYLSVRCQRVVLNGQTSLWRPILAGVPQRSILSTLLFLIYINDLPNELKSNVTLFADGTSLFTVVKDKNESANVLRSHLQSISIWAHNWKCFLIKILVNRFKKCDFQEKITLKFAQP